MTDILEFERMLAFLARDIADHPERLVAVDSHFVQRIQALIGGTEVDLSAALSEKDE